MEHHSLAEMERPIEAVLGGFPGRGESRGKVERSRDASIRICRPRIRNEPLVNSVEDVVIGSCHSHGRVEINGVANGANGQVTLPVCRASD